MAHAHYTELSKWLIARGRTDCDPLWVKKMLKHKFLGYTRETMTDIVTGETIEKEHLIHTSDLDVGEMTNFISNYLAWGDDLGCYLKVPADSEYMKLMESQNQ